jgi:hypothetical protein
LEQPNGSSVAMVEASADDANGFRSSTVLPTRARLTALATGRQI